AEMLRQKKAFVNMYLAFRKWREESLTKKERDKLYKKLLADEPSIFDSHPTFSERMEAADLLPKARRPKPKLGNGTVAGPAPAKDALTARQGGVAVKKEAAVADEF